MHRPRYMGFVINTLILLGEKKYDSVLDKIKKAKFNTGSIEFWDRMYAPLFGVNGSPIFIDCFPRQFVKEIMKLLVKKNRDKEPIIVGGGPNIERTDAEWHVQWTHIATRFIFWLFFNINREYVAVGGKYIWRNRTEKDWIEIEIKKLYQLAFSRIIEKDQIEVLINMYVDYVANDECLQDFGLAGYSTLIKNKRRKK